MAPVIFGLDLAEMKWGKFKSSYMFGNRDFHLRRTKFIVYQCALIFCVVSESLGTSALSDYVAEQKKIHKVDPHAHERNDDYVGAASYNIFAGVFVAFIFGAAFFFDLFWPMRRETRSVRIAWKVCGVLAVVFHFADAICLTVITATHAASIGGVPRSHDAYLVSQYEKAKEAPLVYRHNGRAVAAVVFVWPGFLSVVGSCILLFFSIDNAEHGKGPLTKHAREQNAITGDDPESACATNEKEKESPEPDAVHGRTPAHTIDGAADDSAAVRSTAATAAS